MFSFFRSADSEQFERQRELWLKIRAKGKQRYSLFWGLGMGGFMFIAMNMNKVVFDHEAIDWSFLPFGALIYFSIAYLFGRFMWNRLESKYGPTSAHR